MYESLSQEKDKARKIMIPLWILKKNGFNLRDVLDILFGNIEKKKDLIRRVPGMYRGDLEFVLNKVVESRKKLGEIIHGLREELLKYVLSTLSNNILSSNTRDFINKISRHLPLIIEDETEEKYLVLDVERLKCSDCHLTVESLEFINELIAHFIDIDEERRVIDILGYKFELTQEGVIKALAIFSPPERLKKYLRKKLDLRNLEVRKTSSEVILETFVSPKKLNDLLYFTKNNSINIEQVLLKYSTRKNSILEGLASLVVKTSIGIIEYTGKTRITRLVSFIGRAECRILSNRKHIVTVKEITRLLDSTGYSYNANISITDTSITYEVRGEKEVAGWQITISFFKDKALLRVVGKETDRLLHEYIMAKLSGKYYYYDIGDLDINNGIHGFQVFLGKYKDPIDVYKAVEDMVEEIKRLEKEYKTITNRGSSEEETVVAFLVSMTELEAEILAGRPISSIYSTIEDLLKRLSKEDYELLKASNLPFLYFFKKEIAEILIKEGYIKVGENGEIYINNKKADEIIENIIKKSRYEAITAETMKYALEVLVYGLGPLEYIPITPYTLVKLVSHRRVPRKLFYTKTRTLLGERTVLEEILEKASDEIIEDLPLDEVVIDKEFEEIYKRNPSVRSYLRKPDVGVLVLNKIIAGHEEHVVSVVEKFFPELIGDVDYENLGSRFKVNNFYIMLIKVNSIQPGKGKPNIFIVERGGEKILVRAHTVAAAFFEAEKTFDTVIEEFNTIKGLVAKKIVTGIGIVDEEEAAEIIGFHIKSVIVSGERYPPPSPNLYYKYLVDRKAYIIPVQRGLYEYIMGAG